MSANRFANQISSFGLRNHDTEWFPRWLARYASFLGSDRNTDLTVTRESVIGFSKQLRDRKVAAWQRLQAVRAIDAYRRHILKSNQPTLMMSSAN